MSLLDLTVAEIAMTIPGATALLKKYDINFCAQGSVILKDAAAASEAGLDEVSKALSELPALQVDTTNWKDASDSDLIDHILTRYHEVHKAQLTELTRLSQRVEKVHAERPGCPLGLAEHLAAMHQELLGHMQKEESILFPLIKSGGHPMITSPISVMMADHESHLAEIEKINALTDNLTLPPWACKTWTALYIGLDAFVADLNMHINKENEILFARYLPKTDTSTCCGGCGG